MHCTVSGQESAFGRTCGTIHSSDIIVPRQHQCRSQVRRKGTAPASTKRGPHHSWAVKQHCCDATCSNFFSKLIEMKKLRTTKLTNLSNNLLQTTLQRTSAYASLTSHANATLLPIHWGLLRCIIDSVVQRQSRCSAGPALVRITVWLFSREPHHCVY